MKTLKRSLLAVVCGAALALAGCSGQTATVDEVQNAPAPVPNSAVNVQTAELGSAAGTMTNASYQGRKLRDLNSRYENQVLPPGAIPVNEAAILGPEETEKYELLYVGNFNTSFAFAWEIYNTWLNIADPYWPNDYVEFEAWSPVTGQVYSVSCVEGPKYVTCTAGQGAVVYII